MFIGCSEVIPEGMPYNNEEGGFVLEKNDIEISLKNTTVAGEFVLTAHRALSNKNHTCHIFQEMALD